MLKPLLALRAGGIVVLSATASCAIDRDSVGMSDAQTASASVGDVVRTGRSGPAASASSTFLCHGTGKSEGYPYPVRDTGTVEYRVTLAPAHVFLVADAHDADFCAVGARCDMVMTADELRVQVHDVPGSSVYSARFRLDLRTRTFAASGGGLDGGWSQTGVCRSTATG